MSNEVAVVEAPDRPQANGAKALTQARASRAIAVAGDLDTKTLGRVLAASGYFEDARDASQAIVKVLYGRELGIGPVTAMMGVHIIEGKPAPSGNLIAAQIRSSGRYDYRVVTHEQDECEIEFVERDAAGEERVLGSLVWTLKDAARADVAKKSNWKKYPRAMLFNRCISEGARVHCPEVFGGAPVYVPEELGADMDASAGAATDEQTGHLRQLLTSHTVSDEHAQAMEAALEKGLTKKRASRAIEGLQEHIAHGEAREKLGKLCDATDPDTLDDAGQTRLTEAAGLALDADAEPDDVDAETAWLEQVAADRQAAEGAA